VRLQDPVSKTVYPFPPGGKIETGEPPWKAAMRETREETGYLVEIDQASESIARYEFNWAGVEYDCVTHFFQATLISDKPAEVQNDPEQRGVFWLPRAEIETAFAFHRPIREAILRGIGSKN
jgi:8-oxo-dGTP pyrophosphatase MutT (NUDIX family)